MRPTVILIFSFLTVISCNKPILYPDVVAVESVIDKFFLAVNSQDSVLFSEIVDLRGQVWIADNDSAASDVTMRTFSAAHNNFDSDLKISEKPIYTTVMSSDGIASAWVPYKLWIQNEFSHCGIDVFTLVKSDDSWKIVNITYTKETKDCDDMMTYKNQ